MFYSIIACSKGKLTTHINMHEDVVSEKDVESHNLLCLIKKGGSTIMAEFIRIDTDYLDEKQQTVCWKTGYKNLFFYQVKKDIMTVHLKQALWK